MKINVDENEGLQKLRHFKSIINQVNERGRYLFIIIFDLLDVIILLLFWILHVDLFWLM